MAEFSVSATTCSGGGGGGGGEDDGREDGLGIDCSCGSGCIISLYKLGKKTLILSQVMAANVSRKQPAVFITKRMFLSDSGIASL